MITHYSTQPAPIGVFDSGFGGLSILREIRKELPHYDYIFLGDNARAPYGTRSYQLVYEFTLQAVKYLFEQGCHLVILACNTASAKALRSIQQRDLESMDPKRRVLGVIRPTVEEIGNITRSRKVGLFGTPGTVQSLSYDIEIAKMHPDIKVFSHACPMWVPLVENRESDGPGADYFVKKDVDALMSQCHDIDSIILGCTHYPLLSEKIRQYVPAGVNIIEQGPIVAASLKDYLRRHPEMEQRCSRGGSCRYCTTEDASRFSPVASIFVNHTVDAHHVVLK